MLPSGSAQFLRCLALVAAAGAFASEASAQQQERKFIDRIMHPDMTLHAEGFEKSFETKASASDRPAAVRPFAFGGRTASTGGFNARAFNDGRGTFRTDGFAVKRATLADQHDPLADRGFATSAVPVREDRLANKSLGGDRAYVDSTKPYLVPGKRQDMMDDLRKQKNLSIDQIRDILNKNK